jgi:hypothetical protein
VHRAVEPLAHLDRRRAVEQGGPGADEPALEGVLRHDGIAEQTAQVARQRVPVAAHELFEREVVAVTGEEREALVGLSLKEAQRRTGGRPGVGSGL